MKIDNIITELENLKTFSFKRYDTEGKVCVDKVGVDIKDLQNIINQLKESSSRQSESVCSSIT
jgi:DNA polymerase III sliding clamp (beta) subunit (PCNA family)